MPFQKRDERSRAWQLASREASGFSKHRLSRWMRSPRGGALIAAVATLAVLLPIWLLSTSWYKTELLNATSSQRAILSDKEIAGIMRINIGTVKSRLSPTRSKMRSSLNGVLLN